MKTSSSSHRQINRHTAFDVANYFLYRSGIDNRIITNKKLQKLVYYAQAWNLALNKKPLFHEKVEAWIHGPTVPELYRKYKINGYAPISPLPRDNSSIFSNSQLRALNLVWETYSDLDTEFLEALTHAEEPWRQARQGFDNNQICTNEIPQDTMRKYYTQRKNEWTKRTKGAV